jgi:hypothetical protein
MATKCHSLRKRRLFGFGIPEHSFLGIDIPENKEQEVGSIAIIQILESEPNEERLDEELKNLIQDKWDFG